MSKFLPSVAAFILIAVMSSSNVFSTVVTIIPPPWVNSGKDLRLNLQTEKQIYRAGEKIILTLHITNIAGDSKVLQAGMPHAQFTFKIHRNGIAINPDDKRPDGGPLRTWTCHPSEPIPVGKSLMEILDLGRVWDVDTPGQYTVDVRKWYLPNDTHRTRVKAVKGIDFLDGHIEFKVLRSPPR